MCDFEKGPDRRQIQEEPDYAHIMDVAYREGALSPEHNPVALARTILALRQAEQQLGDQGGKQSLASAAIQATFIV